MDESRSSAVLLGPSQIADSLGYPHPGTSALVRPCQEAQGVGLPLADSIREWTRRIGQ
jgi:hypothetical protein